MRADVKRILDHLGIKYDKLGCCNVPPEAVQRALQEIKKDPAKWKEFFKAEAIHIFDKNRVIVL